MSELLKRISWLFVFCFACSLVLGDEAIGNVLCYKESCEEAKCPDVNCTNGTLLTSPSYECGCCKLCLEYLGKGDTCGLQLSSKECGPGLYCKDSDGKGKYICTKKETKCFQAQDAYDARKKSGTLGMYEARPECDSEGEYEAKKCTPGGSCYCLDKQGERIFGDGLPDSSLTGDYMNCLCSRYYEAAQNLSALDTAQFLHCLPNGNYDKLQCIGQACFCMSPEDQTMTSSIKPITNIEDLPCFKEEMHYHGYYRPCERERNKARLSLYKYASSNITVLNIDVPTCAPDGYYHSIRKGNSKLFCADPVGEKIEDFEVSEDSSDAKSMNCHCARSRYWLNSLKTAKPICCKNGNFRPIQCRGGVCFCVDENGEQSAIEVPSSSVASLSCYNSATFPEC